MTAIAEPREIDLAASQRPQLPAWPLVLTFVAAVALLLLAGKPGMVRMLYPVGALALGGVLYLRGPGPYIEFSWWLWHVSPGLRRIVDYQMGGWDPQNPMSLTPFLVGGLAAIGVLRRLPELRRPRFLPWAVASACVIYGYFTGVLRVGIMPATHALISWLVPLLFGLYCALEWRRYPECRAAMRRAFLFGSMVLAVYGIYQFVNPPEWDRVWMVSSGMYSVGRAFPYEVRVFSLVNAPLPFATILVAGLFIALSGRGLSRIVSLSLGVVALLLSLVRSAWIAGALGLLVYLAALPVRAARRLVVAAVLTVVAVSLAPLFAPADISGPTVRIIRERALTLFDLEGDVSFKDRTSFLDNISTVVVDEPLGHGLGSTGVSSTLGGAGGGIRDFDNGVFAALYSLGWVAGVGLLAAVLMAVVFTIPRREGADDTMAKAARAVAVLSLVLTLGANVFEGVSAAVLWGFLGLVTAAHQWHDSTRWEQGEAGA